MLNDKEIEAKILKRVRDHYKKSKPKFEKIPVKDVEFYLAKPIIWSFRIPKAQLPNMKKLLQTDDLDEYFSKNWYGKPVYDEKGNMVEIPLGSDADIWPFDELPKFKECVDVGSYCVFQDDTGRFWKIEWKKDEITYWKQTSEVDPNESYLEILNLLLEQA